jgi:hypothetical protein
MKEDVNNKHFSLRLTDGVFCLDSQPLLGTTATVVERVPDSVVTASSVPNPSD